MAQIIAQFLASAEYVFAIVTLLGGVIAVHEFGHFIFAKWNNIRVDMFSIGFGPKLFSRKYGETEYCLSLIPLGGFVKIYGQDPEEVAKDPTPTPERSFSHKPLLAKLSVLIGGPAFNYLMAIAIFMLLAMAGMQKLPPYFARVIPDSPAFQAGLRSGDRVVSIEGETVKTFDEVFEHIAKNPMKTLKFSLLRDGKPMDLNITTQKENSLTPYGEKSIAGNLEGFESLAREPIVSTTLPQHLWGFKTGDKILEVERIPVKSWEEMESVIGMLLEKSPARLNFKVERDHATIDIQSTDLSLLYKVNVSKDPIAFLSMTDLHSPELFVKRVAGGAPAEKAGLLKGDRILSVSGEPVYSFDHLRTKIQHVGEKASVGQPLDSGKEHDIPNAAQIEIERNGKRQVITTGVRSTKGKDPLGETVITYTIGIESAGVPLFPKDLIIERTLNPFKAFWIGMRETWNNTVMTVVGLKKLAFGEVSAKSMGGPIMIGKLAGDTLSSRGWRDFLRIMAIISISLGVFNLLPVPILDGGHVVFAVMESVRGRPLSNNAQQWIMKVGLSLVLMLMVFALYNDITRVITLPF